MSEPFSFRLSPEDHARLTEYAEEAGLHPAEFIRTLVAHSEPDVTVAIGGVTAGPPDWDTEAADLLAAEKAKDREDLEGGGVL
ncbi:hypothetical protein GMA12_00105 [Kocuria sediminis]|uniref:Uncharacterized protein n=1 Tax=Kocuria sediminis TaxID=1038857 RepID=A0A6N8GH52_9MICC|nr:hypothetical protein [Kocuria sediminis]MUN61572.1 hypothetical protein [Kocuria sediminis]